MTDLVPSRAPRPRPAGLPLLMAFDLDGTLVPELHNEPPAASAAALRRLHALGVRLCVITGRDLVPPPVASLPFDALCSQNGGRLEVQGKVLTSASFDPQDLDIILNHGLEGARLIVYSDGMLYLDLAEGDELPDWIMTRGYRPLAEARSKAAEKVGLFHPEAAQFAQQLREKLPHLELTGAQPPYGDYLTITPAGAHKGAALLAVAEQLGIPPQRCVAFGDTDNDAAMFEVAGYAVQSGDLPMLARYADTQISDPEGLGAYLESWANALAAEQEA